MAKIQIKSTLPKATLIKTSEELLETLVERGYFGKLHNNPEVIRKNWKKNVSKANPFIVVNPDVAYELIKDGVDPALIRFISFEKDVTIRNNIKKGLMKTCGIANKDIIFADINNMKNTKKMLPKKLKLVCKGNLPFLKEDKRTPLWPEILGHLMELGFDEIHLIIMRSFCTSNRSQNRKIRNELVDHKKWRIDRIHFIDDDIFEEEVRTIMLVIKKDKVENESRPVKIYKMFTHSHDIQQGQSLFFESKIAGDIIAKIEKVEGARYYESYKHQSFTRLDEVGNPSCVTKSTPKKYKQLSQISNPVKFKKKKVRVKFVQANEYDKHINEARVVRPPNGDQGRGLKLSWPVKPGVAVKGVYSVWCFGKNFTHAKNRWHLDQTMFANYLYELGRSSRQIQGAQLRFIPDLDLNQKWTDKMIQKRYGFTMSEMLEMREVCEKAGLDW